MSTRKLALYGKGKGPSIPCFQRPSRLIVVGDAVTADVDGKQEVYAIGSHSLGAVGGVCVNYEGKLPVSCFVECD